MKVIFFFAFLLAFVFVYPAEIHAYQSVKYIPKDQVITSVFYGAADSYTISGILNDDAYIAGGSVVVDGVIKGDLFVAGGTVTIRGVVEQNLRVAGGTVIVNGKIGRNVTVLGGTVQFENQGIIGGSILVLGGSLSINAAIQKDATLYGGQVFLNAPVGGTVYSTASVLNLGDQTNIKGDLQYTSENTLSTAQGATVSGAIRKIQPAAGTAEIQRQTAEQTGRVLNFLRAGFNIVSLISSLIIGMIMIYLFPRRMMRKEEILVDYTWQSLGIGLLVFLMTPVIALLLILTIVTIPLALVLLFVYMIILYTAKIWIAFSIGRWIMVKLGREDSLYGSLIMGLLGFFLITYVPVLGWMFSFVSSLFGTGVFIIEIRDFYRQIAAKKIN